jgi:hypothetical protein
MYFKPTTRNKSLHENSHDSRRVLTFATQNLLDAHTVLPHWSNHKYTWISRNGKTNTPTDDILKKRRLDFKVNNPLCSRLVSVKPMSSPGQAALCSQPQGAQHPCHHLKLCPRGFSQPQLQRLFAQIITLLMAVSRLTISKQGDFLGCSSRECCSQLKKSTSQANTRGTGFIHTAASSQARSTLMST